MRRALVGALAAAGLCACDGARRDALPPRQDESAPAFLPAALPDACLLRFEVSQGAGFEREGWDLEILQIGPDIRARGGVRTGGSYAAVYRTLSPGEFTELWTWMQSFPLDRFRAREDPEAEAPGWRKRMKFDAVLDAERRHLSENEWKRPLTGADWVRSVEDRLHLLVLEYAEEALDEVPEPGASPGTLDPAVQRAIEALGDGDARNLRGGAPDGG